MDSGWFVVLALALGLVIGVVITTALGAAARHGQRVIEVVSTSLPDGIDQILEAMESPGIVVDPSNNVLKASPSALSLGLVANAHIVHAEFAEIVDRVRRHGETVTQDVVVSRGPFGEASMNLSVRATRLGSRYVLILAEDHSESRRLEEVRRDFVANISHELKTPIGAVGLLAEALHEAADDPDQVQRFAKRLTQESARLARITREIIDLSRLQATDVIARSQALRVDEIVTQAIDQNRVAAESHDIQLVKGGDKKSWVRGDESLLVTAVHNLIANAIQYSPTGSRIGVGVKADGAVVEIAVTDQGVGIPEADLDRVFERFYRVDQARSRNTGGTGLGLSIVKHAVQNHGGDIRVWSKPGHGSTFTIRLPQSERAESADTATIGESQ